MTPHHVILSLHCKLVIKITICELPEIHLPIVKLQLTCFFHDQKISLPTLTYCFTIKLTEFMNSIDSFDTPVFPIRSCKFLARHFYYRQLNDDLLVKQQDFWLI